MEFGRSKCNLRLLQPKAEIQGNSGTEVAFRIDLNERCHFYIDNNLRQRESNDTHSHYWFPFPKDISCLREM